MQPKIKRKHLVVILFLFFLLCGLVLACPWIGSKKIDAKNIISAQRVKNNPDAVIFYQLRIPRVFLAVLAGAALAGTGLVLQTLLRNPLADSFSVGISGGASLGAVLAIRLGWEVRGISYPIVTLSGFIGALAVMLFISLLAKNRYHMASATIILAGVTVNFVVSSLITLMNFFSDFMETRKILIWLMGGMDVVTYRELLIMALLLIVGFIPVFRNLRSLDILAQGAESARGLGVDVPKLEWILFIGTSIAVASVVAIAGPIGFVGLIVPHVLRIFLGSDHRLLLPASMLAGGAFLLASDTLARTLLAPLEIPVGCITTVLGGPFFMFLLYRNIRKQGNANYF